MRNLMLRFVLVAMVVALGQYSAAIGEPANKPNTKSMSVAELEKAGDEARAQKDYVQAIRYFTEAVGRDRKNAVLYNKLGLSQLKNNDLTGARASFQMATKRNSKMADALNNLGAVEYVQRNYGGAAKQFKKAIALNETTATFHVNLGAAWFGQKKFERALAEYARALELDPNAFDTASRTGVVAQISNSEERAKYSYMLAKIYAKRGDAEHCLQCLRRAKEEGYRDLINVYKDEEFAGVRQDKRLAEIVPPPQPK